MVSYPPAMRSTFGSQTRRQSVRYDESFGGSALSHGGMSLSREDGVYNDTGGQRKQHIYWIVFRALFGLY
jgi:hypothetical protein